MHPWVESLMDDTPGLAWVKDVDGRYLYANRTWLLTFGWSMDAIVGRSDFDLFAEDVARNVRENDARVRQSGKAHHYVEQETRADGQTHEWLSLKFPGRDGQVCGFAIDITEQRRTEAKLRISEERLAMAQELAHLGYFEWDPGADTVWFSTEMYRIYGYDPERDTITRRSLIDRVHPDHQAEVLGRLEDFARNASAVHDTTTIPLLTPAGGKRYVHTHAHAERDAGGRLVLLRGTALDVTELMRAHAEVDASHAMLQAIHRAQLEFIGGGEARSAFQLLLDLALELTGGSFGFVGEIVHVEGGAPFLRTLACTDISWDAHSRGVYAAGVDTGIEFRNLDNLFGAAISTRAPVLTNDVPRDPRRGGAPAGHPTIESFMGLPFFRGDRLLGMLAVANRPGGFAATWIERLQPFLSTCANILDAYHGEQRRRAAEAALRDREAQLRAVIDHASDGIFVTDAAGVLLDANQAGCDMLGLPREQIVGHDSAEFIDPHERPILERTLHEVDVGHDVQREWQFSRADGQRVVAEVNTSRLPDGQNLSIVRDVTERKEREARERRNEAALRQTQKLEAVGTLAGGIAHDFNNLLAVIQGNAELVDETLGPQHELAESLADLRIATRRAKELVTRILTFSRQRETPLLQVQLPAIVDEAVRLLRSTIPARVELRLTIAPDVPEVMADATQLHQLVVNLVTNAWQALGNSAGEVSIEVARADHHPELSASALAVLRVRDDGPGIDPEALSRIFEPFFTTKSAVGGTGLGLSVVHGIVRAHGGALVVDSVVGRGATFSVFLPAAIDAAASARESVSPRRARGLGEMVLLIDNEDMLVKTVHRQLESLGYRVESYRDPGVALRAFEAKPQRYAAVVTDHDMPGTSGIELCRQMRRVRADLPVVLSSGFLSDEERAEAREAGVATILGKPSGLDELAEAVGAACAGER